MRESVNHFDTPGLDDVNYDKKILSEHNYKYSKKLSETLKGVLFVAEQLNTNNEAVKFVCIKKMPLLSKGSSFLTTKDTIIPHTVNYIDAFESCCQKYLYSVVELDFSLNLQQFVDICMNAIRKNQLSVHSYRKTIKYLSWKLVTAVDRLQLQNSRHIDLDICPENILLENCNFVPRQNNDSKIDINSQIDIKIFEFGTRKSIQNNKKYSVSNKQYVRPTFDSDGRATDMWRIGMLFYFCFMGDYPLKRDVLCAINNDKLKQYLLMNRKLSHKDKHLSSLLTGLLHIDPVRRFNMQTVLKSKFFKSFYNHY